MHTVDRLTPLSYVMSHLISHLVGDAVIVVVVAWCMVKSFCVSERFQPPGQGSTYLKIKGREAWLLQSTDSEGEETCLKLPPPMDEVNGCD